MKKIFAMILILICAMTMTSLAQTRLERGISPNGPVFALERKGNVLYAGGSFDKVGYLIGGAACFSDADTLPLLDFPYVDGDVEVIISDGNNGWYLGGEFEIVETTLVKNLVHIKPDFSVDTTFNLEINNEVSALVLKDNLLYIGGRFTEIAGESRQYIAAYDLSASELTEFNPKPNNYIRDLEIYSSSLIVGGLFNSIDTTAADGLARFSLAAGEMEDIPTANGRVHTLLLKGDTLYAGGSFPNRLMAIDLSNHSLLNWSPVVSGFGFGQRVNALALIDTLIYFGGYFGTVNGQARINLGAVSLSGNLAAFSPDPDGEVFSLLNDEGELLAGGEFYHISGDSIPFAAKLNRITGEPGAWNMKPDWSVNTMLKDGNLALTGGEFRICQYVERDNAFAMDLTNFQVLDWDPKTDFLSVSELKADKSRDVVYMVGWNVEKLKAVDGTTGEALPGWAIETDKAINAVAQDSASGILYIAGEFDLVKGESRTSIAALDKDGNLLSFSADVDGEIMDVDLYNNSLYLAGHFDHVAGQERLRMAALAPDGNLLTWYPRVVSLWSLSYYPHTLEPHKGRIYVAGWYNEMNGEERNGAAAVDAITGDLLPWDLRSNVLTIERIKPFNNGFIIATPYLTEINAISVDYISFVDADSGKVLTNVPNFGFNVANSIADLETLDTVLIAGGGFRWLENQFHPYLAFFAFPKKVDGLPDPGPLPDPEPEPDPEITAVDSRADKSSARIYPNPATETLFIKPEALTGKLALTLSDLTGRIILKEVGQANAGEAIQLDISSAPKGIYIVQLLTGSRREYFKLVKE